MTGVYAILTLVCSMAAFINSALKVLRFPRKSRDVCSSIMGWACVVLAFICFVLLLMSVAYYY